MHVTSTQVIYRMFRGGTEKTQADPGVKDLHKREIHRKDSGTNYGIGEHLQRFGKA